MTHFPKSLHCVWAGVVAVLLNTPFFMQAAPVTTNYSYNSAGFLAAVNRNGAVIASYNYDANGNVTSVVTPAGSTSYAYDAQDRLLTAGATSFTYTDAGEMKTRVTPNGTTSYSYDEFGQLRHVSLPDGRNLDYVLGSPEMRIAKKVNGAVVQGFLRDEKGDILAELDGGNTVVSRFVYSELSATPESMSRGTDTFRIITDALGSVRLVMHAQTGAIAQRIDYDEWGQITLDTNPGFQPFGFVGGIYDKDTGLVRFGARDYDPSIRRWTSPDPINFRSGSTNLYAYVNNTPLNLVDRSGLGPKGEPPPLFPRNNKEREMRRVFPVQFRQSRERERARFGLGEATVNVFQGNTAGNVTVSRSDDTFRDTNERQSIHGTKVFAGAALIPAGIAVLGPAFVLGPGASIEPYVMSTAFVGSGGYSLANDAAEQSSQELWRNR